MPAGHPDSLWVTETALLDGLHEFLTQHVFGPYRRLLLATTLDQLDQSDRHEHAHRLAATEKALREVEQRRRRLVHILEIADDPDPALVRDVNNRRAELAAQHDELSAELRRLHNHRHQQPNPDMLDTLPVGPCDIAALPEPLARRLFEALRLEIHYHKADHTARYRITLTADTLGIAQQIATSAVAHQPAADAEDQETPRDLSERFPSALCPRRDSNLRHSV